MTDGDDLYDVSQAAEYLTVSRATVYREHKRGRIRFVKVAGSTRVRRTELDRYLATSERTRSRVA